MLSLMDKNSILDLYRRGKSKRSIARELSINRKTVERYVLEYENALRSDNPSCSLTELYRALPEYDSANRRRRVITDAVKDVIKRCLDENQKKRANGLSKQCKTKSNIYEQLVDSGFTISYASVCKYISLLEDKDKQPKDAFIRGYYDPGDECEFDWGDVKVTISGERVTLQMAVFTLAHSNGRKAYLFRRQDTQAFMESHRNFFRECSGVPRVMVYDNMRVAISKFIGREKKPTDALVRLMNFYGFSTHFCNIRAGWEKGHVERSVSVIRRNAFAFKDSFDSIAEANEYLSKVCDRLNNKRLESFRADVESLTPNTHTIGCFEMSAYKVDKWSTVCHKAVHYSVPDHLVGKMVDVKIYSEKLVIFYEGEKITSHIRKYFPGDWVIDIEHFIRTFTRKPGAIASSVALRQADEQIRKMYNYFKDTPRDFIMLLHHMLENKLYVDDILNSYSLLKKLGIMRPSVEQIKAKIVSIKENVSDIEEYNSVDFKLIERTSVDTLNDLTEIMNNNTVLSNNNTGNGTIKYNKLSQGATPTI